MSVAAPWDQRTAYAQYRGTMHRMAAWYPTADCFDQARMAQPSYQAADRACQAAWTRQDWPGLARALATWEHTLIGTGS